MKNFTSSHLINKCILISAVLISFNNITHAQAITVANGNWANPSIWNGNIVPISGESIIIAHNIFYDINIVLGAGSSLTINPGASLCGIDTFKILCGGNFYCNGLMSGTVINVTDGTVSSTGSVYAQDAFNYNPCMAGFINNGSIITGQPFSCNPLGVDENNSAQRINISPNPFFNNLTISTKTNESLEIAIYDITSRKFLQQQFTNTVSLNTAALAKGIYLYEIKNRDGSVKKGKNR